MNKCPVCRKWEATQQILIDLKPVKRCVECLTPEQRVWKVMTFAQPRVYEEWRKGKHESTPD